MREIAPVIYAKSVSGPTWNKNLRKIPFPFPPTPAPLPSLPYLRVRMKTTLLGITKYVF